MTIRAELVGTTTPDGLHHHGLLFEPPDGGETWVIHVHGSCSNFYQEPFVNPLAEALTGIGVSLLTVNTRGHDAEAYVIGRSVGPQRESWQIGSRRDIFGECVHDLTGWLGFARDRGATRIVLSGHSAGATKIAHHAASAEDSAIVGLIALSPGDPLARYRRRADEASLEEHTAAARELAADDPAAMRPGRFLSAAAFLSLFDHLDQTGVFAFSDPDVMGKSNWPQITAPSLVVFGGADAGYVTPIAQNIELLEKLRRPGAPLTIETIKKAGHYFAGAEDRLAKCVAAWVEALA